MKSSMKETIGGTFEGMDAKVFYLILGVGLLAVFLLDYFLLMAPQLKTLSKINPEIKILGEDIGKARNNIQRLAQYQSQVTKLTADIALENKKVELRDEVPLILEHISRVAGEYKVKINQIMPNVIDSEIVLENDERIYYDLPIDIEARAGYHDLGRFVNAIEQGSIFLKVGELTIAGIEGRKDLSIKVTFDALVYDEIK
ncbi:MAG: type 4a pilus biogenesis protein PilO [Candidatus Omnitrophica bacterium]|nr:type 4a pilus biogenesis protein PilO [Candidatus Omnitrophota bacterium]